METAIEYKNIKKCYGGRIIIEDFNLAIEKGSFVTIIGSSGCGKTTILKMVNGLMIPDSGAVFVDGKDIQKEDRIALRRNIGYAIQGNVLFPHMTVEQNIAYVPNLLNKQKDKTKNAVKKWVEIVGLDKKMLKRYPDELSGGQQQRVGIARSLAASPDILLMDEPFGAVDEITREQLQEELLRIHKQTATTIVFVTHDITEAIKLATKMLVMDEGALMQYDDPQKILKDPANDTVYQLVARAREHWAD